MKRLLMILISLFAFGFISCAPEISIKAKKDGSVDVSFKTGFTPATAKILKLMSNIPDEEPLFSVRDLSLFMVESGARFVKVDTPSDNEIMAGGNIEKVEKSVFSAIGMLSYEKDNALTFTFGPEELIRLYNLLDTESKNEFDMMMIPCLIGEEMSFDEYKMLLASLYGPTFAIELVEGNVSIVLENSSGKKTKATFKLGDLLTLKSEKKWVLE